MFSLGKMCEKLREKYRNQYFYAPSIKTRDAAQIKLNLMDDILTEIKAYHNKENK